MCKGIKKRVQNSFLGDNAIVECVDGERMCYCTYHINTLLNVPVHCHNYEQTVCVLEGEMDLILDGQRITMKPGDVQMILSNQKHGAEIKKVPFYTIEHYSPVRTDLTILED